MTLPLVFVASVVCIASASADVVFQGYMTTSEGSLFVLSAGKERSSGWLAVGQQFDGVSIVAFDSKTELLTVEQDGKRQAIRLADGKTQATSGERAGAVAKPIVILIGKGESISVGDDVAMMDALKKKFELVAAMNPQPAITLRPPGDATFDRLILVLDLLKKAGITRFDISSR
jgi:biopolymer transport protein ExbD